MGVLCPTVLVKIRFCGGCSVSRAHKTSLRLILFCICRVLPSSLLTLKVVIINTTAYIIQRQIIDDDFISATRGMASPSSAFGLFPTVNVILETKTEVLTTWHTMVWLKPASKLSILKGKRSHPRDNARGQKVLSPPLTLLPLLSRTARAWIQFPPIDRELAPRLEKCDYRDEPFSAVLTHDAFRFL